MNIIQWLRAKFAPDVEPKRYNNTKDRAFTFFRKARRKKNKNGRKTRRR